MIPPSEQIDQFLAWREEVLERIRSISAQAAGLYSTASRLPHYMKVSDELAALSSDSALPRAAFLHGLGGVLVAKNLSDVGDDVTSILRARESLASLGVESAQRLESDVLPSIDPRAGALVVFEQVAHVDPRGALGDWVRAFRSSPSSPPAEEFLLPQYLNPHYADDLPRYCKFLTSIVAPTARYLGLWREKDILEDAALLLATPGIFHRIVEFVLNLAERTNGWGAYRSTVEDVLSAANDIGRFSVNWEWRRVASMHAHLPQNLWDESPATAVSDVDTRRFGFVTVTCETDDSCYLALRRLHRAGQHRDSAFRDYIANPLATEYGAALHTDVALAGAASDGRLLQVPVRIFPESAVDARLSASSRALSRVGKGVANPLGDITVFAPDGRPIVLPRGGTVLNYAYRVHNELPAFARAAQVNGQSVDVLWKLSHGDVVWLETAKEPRSLPDGWETAVPPETVHQIRLKHRTAMRSAYVKAGRVRLGGYLLEHGIGKVPDDAALDAIVDRVARLLRRRSQASRANHWWYEQLVIQDEIVRDGSRKRAVQSIPLSEFLEQVTQHAALLAAVERLQQDPQNDLGTETGVCPKCNPTLARPCVVSFVGGTALLHDAGARCVTEPSRRIDRLYLDPQYIAIKGPDRIGLIADVCEVVRRHGIGIENLIAVRLGHGQGLIRLRTRPTPPQKLDVVVTELGAIPNVEVRGTAAEEFHEEAQYLPQRVAAGRPARRQHVRPYTVGAPIADDRRFYGMAALLDVLDDYVKLILSPAHSDGQHVFVHGPKKVGKTSAIRCFLRRLAHERKTTVLSVYLSAEGDEPWSHYEPRLHSALMKAAIARATEAQIAFDVAAARDLSLLHLIQRIRDQLRCVVVVAIDEAMKLMRASASEKESAALLAFATPSRHVAQLLTIWIGPTSNTRRSAAMHEILQASEHELVPPLSKPEIAALVRAEKAHPTPIQVNGIVIGRIWGLTLGNPFWVANLAKKMWENSSEDERGVVVYDETTLTDAQDSVASSRIVFSDRYRQPPGASREQKLLAGAVLLTLAAGSSRSGGMERDDITKAVEAKLGDAPDPTVVAEMLDDFADRGTVRATGETAWRISAPLLAKHIVRVSGGVESWLT